MRIGVVDANVLVRFKTKDEPQKAERAQNLFERVSQKKEYITTSEAVLAEVVFVLSSKKLYNVPRDEIRAYLEDFIKLKGLKIPNKKLYLRALELYEISNLDFPDTLLVAYVEHKKADYLISFDAKIDRVGTIERQEP